MTEFVHLHVHTQYSLLDGAIRVSDLMKQVSELGMSAVAMTDHGNMYGAVDFQKAAQKKGLKPIIGCEMYMTREPYDAEEKQELKSYHLTLLARSLEGYRNLVFLNSMAWLKGVHPRTGVPRIDFDLLRQHNAGIIALSGDLGGEINQALLRGSEEEARAIARLYKSAFPPDHYYLEIMDNALPEQQRCNEALIAMADELDIPLVATNDCHYIARQDARAHAILMSIQLGKTVDVDRLMEHGVDQLYVRSPQEMAEAFAHVPEAISNTVKIAEMCDLTIPLGQVYLPKYRVPEAFKQEHQLTDLDESIHAYFRHISWEGLAQRFREMEAKGVGYDAQLYRDRLQEELDIICKMEFPGYFLIVWDFINWAKVQGIPVGPGRGSGAGSLVAYSLAITNLDPIPYDLLFERFLNPERVSMPDFDIDFCMNRRGEVIQYVTQKYGEHNVGQIITYGQLKARACVRDVGRALGLSFGETDRIAKLIPEEIGITLKDALDREPRLRQARQEDARVDMLFDIALSLENLNRQAGMHAAGIVISETPLWDYVPICRGANDELVTQFAKNEVEEAGLVKFDFLGLKTLTVLETAINLINTQRQAAQKQPFDLEAIPLTDNAIFKMISAGDTTGVFQLESSGFQELLKKLKPDCFEDIVAAVALYRPGPLGTGMVDDFIDRKHGRKKVEYPHPWLEDVLKPTYGVMVYQEQVMMTARVMAGYSLGGADLLRRCVTGDTLVVRADTGARVRVDSIEPGTLIHTIDDQLRVQVVPVQERIDNGMREVWRVRTRSGRSIHLTHDHPLLTVEGWRHLSDLRVGDAIAAPTRLPTAAHDDAAPERVKLLAYLIGDGQTLNQRGHATSRFYNSDDDLLDDFDRCARALGADTTRYAHPDTRVTTITCKGTNGAPNPVTALVEATGIAARAEHKRLPNEVFSYSPELLRLFLGALWSTDGSVERKRLSYSSSSPQLIDDLAHALLRLGIVTVRRARTTARLPNYELIITDQRDLLRFHDQLASALCPTKRARLTTLVSQARLRTRNQSIYNVPAPVAAYIAQAKQLSGLSWSQAAARVGTRGGDLSSGLNLHTPTRALSRHRLAALATAFDAPTLHHHAENDLLWDPITEITPAGTQRVYDLAVPPHANFIAADLCIHNSMGKKKPEVMAQQKGVFVEGAVAKEVSAELAGSIFDLMAYFAGYGFNKCLVGETEIMDARTGQARTIEAMFNDREALDVVVHALGDDQRLHPRRVSDVVWNGVKPVFELRTKQGKTITATGNHPFRTLDGWTNLEDLRPGDRIAAPRQLSISEPSAWRDEEMIVLGWLLSEGNTCHPSCLYMYNNERDAVEDFARAVEVFDHTRARITQRPDRRCLEVCVSTGQDARFSATANDKDLPTRSGAYQWAEGLGLLYKTATQKKLPAQVMGAPDRQIALLLGRLWSGDGFIANATQHTPYYATSSPELAQGVSALLCRLGILNGVHHKTFKYNGDARDGYTVHLLSPESRGRFIEHVAPHIVGRGDALATLRNHHERAAGRMTRDTLPVEIREHVRAARARARISWSQLKTQTGQCVRDLYGEGPPHKKGFRRDTIARFASALHDPTLAQHASSDIFWDEIVSIEPRGTAHTYDLTVEDDHNFVANGLIVHNSHSAAYALITYQTAYLKAHFPVEFMAALMTNDRDNTDKVVRFINEAKAMGIEVLPPDVNESQLDFSVADGKIRFGLAAIKGVGAGVIESIIEAREKGAFKSLYDFCTRVDLKRCNKRTIEALVKCGAFDAVGPGAGSRFIGDHCAARASMMEAIGLAVERGQKQQHDRQVGQSSLFGMLTVAARDEVLEETYPDALPWSDRELLKFERDLIGFYVTGHPLDRFEDEVSLYQVTPTSQITLCRGLVQRDAVTIAGVISEYRERPLKSGGRMAFLTLEDKTGGCEVLVFSAAFDQNEAALKSGDPLLIKGQFTIEGDADTRVGKVRAAEAIRLIDARKRYVHHVAIELDADETTPEALNTLKTILKQHPGGCTTHLVLSVKHPLGSAITEMTLPAHLGVEPSDELLTEIERLFRRKAVRLSS